MDFRLDFYIDDAVAYLKEMKDGAVISYDVAKAWATKYKLPPPERAAFEAIVGK